MKPAPLVPAPSQPPAVAESRSLAPARPALTVLTGWLLLGVVTSVWPWLVGVWAAGGTVLAVVFVVDAILLSRTPTPSVTRELARSMSLGESHTITVRLDATAERPVEVELHHDSPPTGEVDGLPRTVVLEPERWIAVPWTLRPTERGTFTLRWVDLRITGPFRLLRQRRRVPLVDEVRVYPNFRAVSRYALLALDDRTAQLGVHTRRRRGQGLEFLQLREYREGDPLRQIDWGAVSRRGQLISREYREEQNQQVVFLLDCGRRMRQRDGDLSFFDRVLDAVLLVSYVALRQGDAVGATTFSGADRHLPPRKGRATLNGLLSGLFDLQPTTAPSDFAEATSRLATRQKRRALVIVVTNLRDDDAGELPLAIAPLRRRHLVLVASLRPPTIDATLHAPVDGIRDAVRVCAAHDYASAREATLKRVKGRGVHTLDVPPSKLPVALVNKYLEIKRAGLL